MSDLSHNPKPTATPVFRLKQWSTLRMHLLWGYEREMLGGQWGSEFYDFQSILLVKQGWARAGGSKKQSLRVDAGEWFVFGQGPRWQQFSSDCVLLSIGFRFQLPTGEGVYDQGLPVSFPSAAYPALKRKADDVLANVGDYVGLGYYLRDQTVDMRGYLLAQNAFHHFLIELAGVLHREGVGTRPMDLENIHVIKALHVLDTAPLGSRMNSKEVAEKVGISLTHLDRLMLTHVGQSVFQYMEARRVCMARDALRASAASLKGIAYDLGFSSPSHFHSWFKKHEGMTPMAYRKEV